MTDIDRMLTEDGARWRAAQPPAPDPDPAALTRPGRWRWQPLAAAAAVVAVAAGALGVAAAQRPAEPPSPAAPAATTPAPVGTPAPADTVVRDGDQVRGQGLIVAVPGRPVRFCTPEQPQMNPAPVPLDGPPDYCPVGVTLVGADLDRLPDRRERSGTVWGTAEITGVYRAGTVTVTAQGIRPNDPGKGFAPALPADCPAPAGGWPRGEVQSLPGIGKAGQYVAAHPDLFGSLSIAYPEPTPSGAIGTQVLVIGTTGDIGEATRAIRRFYAGSLCVRPVEHSRAQMLAARAVLVAALSDPAQRARYGLIAGAGETSVAGDPRTAMDVLVYTAAADALRRQAGPGLVEVEAVLRVLR
ncbi:MAG TPA: hypothetical protein VI357_16845 [Mycobacteriales bacterium]